MPAKGKRTEDARFDTSSWGTDLASTSNVAALSHEEGESETNDALEEDEEDDEQQSISAGSSSSKNDRIVKPLSKEELKRFHESQKKRGIVYISRIPIGMTVAKVRHLLGGFGEVERIYLQDGREKERGDAKPTSRRAAKAAHFTEGWVEFNDKRVAKTVASMLNAEPIGAASGGTGGGKGGKRAGGGRALRRWKDEVWTMKYLPGFKWNMLSEQLANERAARASRVRAELAQSSFEQKDYLQKVERARVMRDKEARRQARLAKGQQGDALAGPSQSDGSHATGSNVQTPHEHTFRQRQAIVRDVREQKTPTRSQSDSVPTERKTKRARVNGDDDDDARTRALQGVLTKIF